MPFGNWSDLDKNMKVSVALNAERRDKAGPSIRCQTIKPLTCLWDFEGTVLLTSHSCIFSAGSMAAFSLSLLLETHPMKQQQEDQSLPCTGCFSRYCWGKPAMAMALNP